MFSEIFTISLHIPWERALFEWFSNIPPKSSHRERAKSAVLMEFFSLHLFPVRKAIWRGAFKKFLSQRVASEKTVFYLCFEYFFTCSHLERSKVVPASKFSSARGRSREEPKIKPFENFFLSSIGRQRG